MVGITAPFFSTNKHLTCNNAILPGICRQNAENSPLWSRILVTQYTGLASDTRLARTPNYHYLGLKGCRILFFEDRTVKRFLRLFRPLSAFFLIAGQIHFIWRTKFSRLRQFQRLRMVSPVLQGLWPRLHAGP